jgi:predicted short-subunit dehydrogenase-like oxidoreductase (DUF2520 family)
MKICIVGTGNVSWHFVHRINACPELDLVQIVGRNKAAFSTYFDDIDSEKIDDISKIDTSCDLYLLCVNDDSIDVIVNKIPFRLGSNQLLIHTSGSKDLSYLTPFAHQVGCLWPIQSLTKGQLISANKFPIGVTGNNVESNKRLFELANTLSPNVIMISESQKPKYHLASVMTNNLVNHIIYQAHEYCKSQNLDFEHLMPLLNHTIEKLGTTSAFNAQTGPARRHDQTTINKQLAMLADFPHLQSMYQLISTNISSTYPKQ